MNAIKTDQVKDSLAYEVSIEPISDISVMGRYTHALKVRYEGLVVDPGFSLYLEPVKELAVTDFHGTVVWYRSGQACFYQNGILVREPISFSVWLECITTACCAFIFEG